MRDWAAYPITRFFIIGSCAEITGDGTQVTGVVSRPRIGHCPSRLGDEGRGMSPYHGFQQANVPTNIQILCLERHKDKTARSR
jgi:hypothetical protein